MVANGTWVNSSDKDTKIVALTTQLKQATKKLHELKKESSNSCEVESREQAWWWENFQEVHQGLR
jgi:hypothetical protein